MGNTYGQVNTLTNVIYACDEEDGEVFEEGSLEREFFDRFYAEADALTAEMQIPAPEPCPVRLPQKPSEAGSK